MAFVVADAVWIELGDWSGCPAALLATLLLLPPMKLGEKDVTNESF